MEDDDFIGEQWEAGGPEGLDDLADPDRSDELDDGVGADGTGDDELGNTGGAELGNFGGGDLSNPGESLDQGWLDEFDGFDLDSFSFDEDFIRAAKVIEATAAERQRAARQANLQRLLADEESKQANLLYEYRRLAHNPDDQSWDNDEHGDDEDGRPNDGGFYPDFDDEYFDGPFDHHNRSGPPKRRRGMAAVSLVVVISVLVVYAMSHFFTATGLRNARDLMAADGSGNPANGTGSAAEPTDPNSSRTAGDSGSVRGGDQINAKRPDGWPPRSSEQQSKPLGTPAAVTVDGPHAFSLTQSDGSTPIAYDPCRPVHYVTHFGQDAPKAAQQLLSDALATVTETTGLRFVDDGKTDEAPADDRAPYQPDRYGKKWAPVLVAWSDEKQSPRLANKVTTEGANQFSVDVLGYAGSTSAGFDTSDDGSGEAGKADANGSGKTPDAASGKSDPAARKSDAASGKSDAAARKSDAAARSGDQIYVTGSLTLDTPDLLKMLGQFDGYARVRAILLHELGHLVGLNHVNDPTQLMNPTLSSSVTEYAHGDRSGLSAVGRGVCMPDI